MANPIQIYEFSTGIHVDVDPSFPGGWVSRGFTGHYMNVTLPGGEVPHEVKRAIANKYFAVVEGGDMSQPAVIGREVEDWSVVAVVSRGRDDGGRPLSVYRYFLCKGKNLGKIVDWMTDYQAKNNQLPIFDPITPKAPGDFHDYSDPPGYRPRQVAESDREKLDDANIPFVLPSNLHFDLATFHSFAKYKASKAGQPIAWAYNAEVLENPRSFVLIHVASDRAYKRIQSMLASAPAAVTPIGFDEQKIKSAIKTLRSRMKPDAVSAIAQEIDNPQITAQNWHTWFDGQGARKAISQPIETDAMARLLTLRAILIPETLPELVRWLEGNEKLQNASLDFQKQFRQYFPADPSKDEALNQKLFDGVCTLLLKTLNKEVDPQNSPYHLKSPESIWLSSYKRLLADLLKSLQEIARNKSPESPILQQILQSITTYWHDISSRRQVISEYEVIAEFFDKIADSQKEYQLAAYFYQVSTGQVETRVFKEAFNSKGINQLFQGIWIRRNVPWLERTIVTTIEGIGAILNSSIAQYIILSFAVFLAVIVGIQASLFDLFLLLITKIKLIDVIALNVVIIVLAVMLNIFFWQSRSLNRTITGAIIAITLCLLLWASFLFRPTPGLTKEQFDGAVEAITNDLDPGLEEDSPQFKNIVKDEFETVLCSGSCPTLSPEPDETNRKSWEDKLIAYQKDQGLWTHGILTNRTKKKVEAQVEENLKPQVANLQQEAQAREQFGKTAREIERFVERLKRDYPNSNPVDIINQFKRSLGADKNKESELQYGVIKNPNSPDMEQKLLWIELITSYQRSLPNFNGDYGVFDLSKLPELEETLEIELDPTLTASGVTPNIPTQPSPTPSSTPSPTQSTQNYRTRALQRFDEATYTSLTQMQGEIYKEIYSDPTQTENIESRFNVKPETAQLPIPELQTLIANYIKQALNNPALPDYRQIYNSPPDIEKREKKQWIDAIYQYQEGLFGTNSASVDGIINLNQGTYNDLKDDVKERVIQDLNN